MDVFQAIYTRRSIGKVKQDPVATELIEKILDAGTWAPNHFHTEPWRFFVLTGDGRKKLGTCLADIAQGDMADSDDEENQAKLNRIAAKPLRAPVLIAVACTPSEHSQVIEIEEIAAVSAAVQNMLLATHALNLGSIWRTGKDCYHPKIKQLFNLTDKDTMLGFLYVGYPDMEAKQGRRKSASEKTTWIIDE